MKFYQWPQNCRVRLRARQKDRILRGKEAQASLAQDGRAPGGTFRSPAVTPWSATSQQVSVAGARGEWRPRIFSSLSKGSSGSPGTSQSSVMTSQVVASSRTFVIDVERNRKGNVSYPHRVYTVPGTPVTTTPSGTGEQGVTIAKDIVHVEPAPKDSETPASEASRYRGEITLEGSKVGSRGEMMNPPSVAVSLQASLGSQTLRQLMPTLPQGSTFQFGSSGHQNLRPPPLLFESGGRSFSLSGDASQEEAPKVNPLSRPPAQDGGLSEFLELRKGPEERIIQGSGKGILQQPEYPQRSYGRESHSTGVRVCTLHLYRSMCRCLLAQADLCGSCRA